ncbi:MAG: uroporphyrinogen-III C-methyltransferase [Gammaproteobacteria bacterium]|nr:uroporphyrinogen-III C-methyltransferase [Gammaproteobacteria bacterium]MCP5459318.1 uroporphyrinogen-III C-methyltransferase [Gammaproteobacteria bacterium]
MTDNDKDLPNAPAAEDVQPATEAPAEVPAQDKPAPSGGGGKLSGLALVLALAAAGASAYLGYAWNQDKQLQEARLKKAFNEVVTERASEFSEMQSRLQNQQSKSDELAGLTQALQGQDEIQQKDAQSLRNGITGLQSEIKSLQGDITTLKGEVEIHKGGVEIQKTDTQNLIAHVRTLQADIKNLQGGLQEVKTGLETQKGDTDIGKSTLQSLQDQTQALTGNLQALQDSLNTSVGERQKSLAELDNRIQNLQLAQRNLLTTLDNVKAVASHGGDVNAFSLSETEYLLRLADDKLKLQSDVVSAANALRVAKARLATVDESIFSGVTTLLDENLAALKGAQLSLPDRSALAHKIFEMEQRLFKLPLRTDVQIAELKKKVRPHLDAPAQTGAEEKWWDQVGSLAWEQFKDVVTIRRERSSGPPLMAVEDEFFLYQNLRLELEGMRIALLAGDASSFNDASAIAVDWLKTYFDTDNEQVKAFLGDLQTLGTVNLNPYIPDISNTLRAFDEVMERRQPVLSTNAANAGTSGAAGETAQ